MVEESHNSKINVWSKKNLTKVMLFFIQMTVGIGIKRLMAAFVPNGLHTQ